MQEIRKKCYQHIIVFMDPLKLLSKSRQIDSSVKTVKIAFSPLNSSRKYHETFSIPMNCENINVEDHEMNIKINEMLKICRRYKTVANYPRPSYDKHYTRNKIIEIHNRAKNLLCETDKILNNLEVLFLSS